MCEYTTSHIAAQYAVEFNTFGVMLKILTVIGARPQIIKAAAISRAIKNSYSAQAREIILHTGQHYDRNMSAVFFTEMKIPKPDYNLRIGSGPHGMQTARMISGIEEIIKKEKPFCILIYGDTNSTLAGAIAGSKVHVPVAHIEAGMRSFNKSMPEEINRVLADHVSTLLFTPSEAGFANLQREGFKKDNIPPYSIDNPKIYLCGDVMYDNSIYFSPLAEKKKGLLKKFRLTDGNYVLVTIHRDYNTDQPARMKDLFDAFDRISKIKRIDFIVPLHPRTQKILTQKPYAHVRKIISGNRRIKITPPASYLEMLSLEKNAFLIMTDSGGVQKEAFFFQKPCITLRTETEWVELVENGNNIVTGTGTHNITGAFEHFSTKPKLTFPPFYGDGKAAEFIVDTIMNNIAR